MIRFLYFVVLLAVRVASEGCHFGYEGAHGTAHWGDDYSECLGKHQSPINIDSEHVTFVSLPPLKLNDFKLPLDTSLTNNGHTAMLTVDSNMKPTLSGGPLNGLYEFAQLHFHWGDDDFHGGENQINNKQYPLELHIVLYKKDYADVNSALSHPDGLCVLGCLFEIAKHGNKNYKGIVETLGKITEANTVEKIVSPMTLLQLMPNDLSNYFTYNGSLTTPPCSEAVTWIDFDNTVRISHEQLQAFRNLTDSECNKMVNNFRAVQPLGDRVVYYTKADKDENFLLRKTKKIISKVKDKLLEIFDLLSCLF